MVRRRLPKWARDGGNGLVVEARYMTNDPVPLAQAFISLISALQRIEAVLNETHAEVSDYVRSTLGEEESRSDTD